MSNSTILVHRPQGGASLQIESGGAITAAGTQAEAIADLTAATGSAGDTIDDVTLYHDDTILNNNFKSLAAKLNGILEALRGVGIIATAEE